MSAIGRRPKVQGMIYYTSITKFGTIELLTLILDIPPLYTSRLVVML